MLKAIAEKLRAARSVVLSTHRNSDGDGLGAQLALYHGLKKFGLDVRVLNVDRPARKYSFLDAERIIEVFGDGNRPLSPTDVALILDTNDSRLVEPLFSQLEKSCKHVCFIDHHPILSSGPLPTAGSVIDVGAASTGELSYRLLSELGVELDPAIARALYTSVAFDTQLFRYVKSSPQSHLMAAELLVHEKAPEEIHRRLFATYTVEKMDLLARALAEIEYFDDNRIAVLRLSGNEFRERGLSIDESGDIIDFVMNVESIAVAALIREDAPGSFKLSVRSKGQVGVLSFAEELGGGGHDFAAGAFVASDFASLRVRVVDGLKRIVRDQGAAV